MITVESKGRTMHLLKSGAKPVAKNKSRRKIALLDDQNSSPVTMPMRAAADGDEESKEEPDDKKKASTRNK